MNKRSERPPWWLSADRPVWAAVAAASYLSRSRRARRAALRGLIGSALSSLLLSLLGRRRPANELPSGGAAAAASFATAAALELRLKGLPTAGLATTWATARVRAGVDPFVPSFTGAALGFAATAASTRVWPVAPLDPPHAPAASLRSHQEPSPDGSGLAIVVNRDSGNGANPADELKKKLPAAEIVEVEIEQGDELRRALDERADRAIGLGVAGGDGSVNTAAQIALDEGKPLVLVPSGTFNHLTGTLGIETVQDSVAAVREGQAVEIDVATIDGKAFLNTASFGGYVEFVDARQRLEHRIGKWPAVVVALIRMLRSYDPVPVEIDGREARVWMAFIGNCRYHPSGFAPSWRERLDDGKLDLRYVDGSAPFARTRLIFAVLTGRLGRCRAYHQSVAERVTLRSLDGPIRLARDGETFDGSEDIVIEKLPKRLAVYVPAEEAS